MILNSRLLYHLRNKSLTRASKTYVQYYIEPCRQYSLKNEKTNKQGDCPKNNSYFTCVAYTTLGASILTYLCYYYMCHKKIHALNKNDMQCGEFRPDLKTYSLEEVGKHDNKDNRVWVIFKQGVYDITDFIDQHPGGSSKILMAAGSSMDPFWTIYANHNTPEIYELLESMRIGNISKTDRFSDKTDQNDPYAGEPQRHKALKINGSKPFCAEPPSSLLVESFITPTELFYVRNHLPVPDVDLKTYTLELAVEETTKKRLSFEDIQKYPKYTITNAVMCAGNRRSEMAQEKPLKGLSWNVGAIGNATWTGARLCDVLKDMGINEDDYVHVQFEGHDVDPSGTPYSASIPISRAMDPRADVILAYEMNGQPISRDHGFPIRVIVPGVVGARCVKWLDKIILSKEESQSQWQQGDYKGFSPNTDWDNVDFSMAPAIQEMPVISAICTPEALDTVKVNDGKINVKGYAWSGGGRKTIRVDVSNDQGNTWHTANLDEEDTNAKEGRYYSWTLWSVDLPVHSSSQESEIWAKAVDASYNVQPESFKHIWNLRGFLCNAYHKVKVKLEH
ncbi:sulfite oxidase [Halictus rubicundus]|uniref:sulfite oxidase n=1 Tax=Halictus rubicundus TaxID=77578 RepID=UPI0040364B57